MSKEKEKLAALLIEHGHTKEAMEILEGNNSFDNVAVYPEEQHIIEQGLSPIRGQGIMWVLYALRGPAGKYKVNLLGSPRKKEVIDFAKKKGLIYKVIPYEGYEEIKTLCNSIFRNLSESLQAYETFKSKLNEALDAMDTILNQYKFKDEEFRVYFRELSKIAAIPTSKEIEFKLSRAQQKVKEIIIKGRV